MTSPMLTVVVLAVLWLIVVVPMIVRRHDDRANERSVEQFGRSMRALTRRHVAMTRPMRPVEVNAASHTDRRDAGSRAELFVPGTRRAALAPSRRRPVPAAEEALMYPVDRADLSPARAQMMARRRRSLMILGLGSLVSLVLAVVVGGPMWVPALLFLTGLGGYLYFLRSQVLRDQERRQARQERASSHGLADYDATDRIETPSVESAVRIDDDDLALHDHDTIDLTGLYDEDAAERAAPQATERRAS
jgi:Flp pilus assembly protein TadB